MIRWTRARRTARPLGLAAIALLALALPACDEEGDTIIVNGLDCGLIREDLAGDWAVTYTPGVATLRNCDDPAWNNVQINVLGGTVFYYDAIAFAGASGAAFSAVASGPDRSNELLASAEADSCLALVQTWEQDDSGWVQCLGTMDRVNDLISGVCDSFDVDSDADGAADVACDLDRSLLVTIGTPF